MSENPLVLIVDDDWMNRELIQNFLEREGFRVLHAANGESAITIAAESLPSLILCDVRMTGMDGYATCEAIKADPKTAAIPVIILTAYETDVERKRAFTAGAADFISKLEGWSRVVTRVHELTGMAG